MKFKEMTSGKTTETAKQSAVVLASCPVWQCLVRHLNKNVQEKSLQETEMVSLFLASGNIYLMP